LPRKKRDEKYFSTSTKIRGREPPINPNPLRFRALARRPTENKKSF
jgi:hypothetical protein